MIAPYLYSYIYLIVCSLFLVVYSNYYTKSVSNTSKVNVSALLVFFVPILAVFIGTRPESVGSDTTQYMQLYEFEQGRVFQWDKDAQNLIFDNLFSLFSSWELDIEWFFILIAMIYFGSIAVACKKLFPQKQEIAFFSCLLAFSTFSYATDGIKAGAAASIFLVALAYRRNMALSVALALLSIGFHHSMKVVAYAYVIVYFYKNTKMYFYGWLFATFIAIAHIGAFQEIFASYADEKGKDYLAGGGFMTGFRPDFILYSAMPIVVGYIMYVKRKIRNDAYELWLRLYLMTNSIWMLCMYASYTNRIAYLSWFLYPIVLIYPYLNNNMGTFRKKEGRNVIMYHMLFTIFMEIVYYGLMK